jgi:tight adherence protein C
MTDPRLIRLLIAMSALAVAIAACAIVLLRQGRRDEVAARRLHQVLAGRPRPSRGDSTWTAKAINLLAALGDVLVRHRLLPPKTLNEVQMLLTGANLRGETVLAAFVGGKVLLIVLLPILFWLLSSVLGFSDHHRLLAGIGGAVVAIFGPDLALGHRRRARLVAIERGLPDALDLLVICADAGLAFEAALERVTREIEPVHPDVAEELAVTANALRIAPDRRAVLLELGSRLDVDFLRRLAATLAQSLQIGAPISRALRQLAQDLRQEQMLRFEQQAARLPVLLTIPMVLFIMPTVLLIIGGPAVVQVIRAF